MFSRFLSQFSIRKRAEVLGSPLPFFERVPEMHIKPGKKESFQVTNKNVPVPQSAVPLLCRACGLILSIVLSVPNNQLIAPVVRKTTSRFWVLAIVLKPKGRRRIKRPATSL